MKVVLNEKLFDTDDCEIIEEISITYPAQYTGFNGTPPSEETGFAHIETHSCIGRILISPSGAYLMNANFEPAEAGWDNLQTGDIEWDDDHEQMCCLIDESSYQRLLKEQQKFDILEKHFGLEKG